MLFRRLKEKKLQFTSQCFCEENKNTNRLVNTVLWARRVNYVRIFAFRWVGVGWGEEWYWNLTPRIARDE
jgi:hypothetical protein